MITHETVESPTEHASRRLLMDFGSAPGSESELTIESTRERTGTTYEVLEKIMQGCVPTHRWGIKV